MRKAIDWGAVKARMAAMQAAEGTQGQADPQRQAAVFAERAKRLGQRRVKADDDTPSLHVLRFRVGEGQYAIEHSEIAEVLPLGQYTPVPSAPPGLFGVLNLRGEILPIIDMARVLELAPIADEPLGYVLVLRKMAAGLKVDQVNEIRRYSTTEIDAGAAIADDRSTCYLKGITRDATLILCVDAVLTHSVFETV